MTYDRLGKISLDGILDDIPAPELVLPDLDYEPLDFDPQTKDLFAEESRKAWHTVQTEEARCDFSPKVALVKRCVFFVSLWKKTVYGRTLSDIKADDAMIPFFAKSVSDIIKEVMGSKLHPDMFAVVSAPKRRHKTHNFASLIAQQIAGSLGVPFFDDCATCRNRQRVNAVFDANNIPPQPNIIVFDDIVTTGSTLLAMRNLLVSLGKNCIFFTGINNKL